MALTHDQQQSLITKAKTWIAEGKNACLLKAGAGASVTYDTGEGQIVSLAEQNRESGERTMVVIEHRTAENNIVEQVGDRIYCLFPPVHGAIATIGGTSIFAYPRPYLEVVDGEWRIYAKVSYTRSEVAIPSSPAADFRRPGLTVSAVVVTIDLYPEASPPSSVSPPDPGGESVEPFAGDYEVYYLLGYLTNRQVGFAAVPFPSSFLGGFSIRTNGAFDVGPGWTWTDGFSAP